MTDIMTPALGESVTEATVARWAKKPGDAVAKDEVLVELETDKVNLEVAAPEAGVLSDILAEEVAQQSGRVRCSATSAPLAPRPPRLRRKRRPKKSRSPPPSRSPRYPSSMPGQSPSARSPPRFSASWPRTGSILT